MLDSSSVSSDRTAQVNRPRLKCLTGLLAPTSGSIRILGEDLQGNSAEIKRQIGVVPEGMALFGRLTAEEYLRFVGRMYGLDRATTMQRTRELLEFMQLADENKKLITDFSHGMQKKLALAAAVIHGPKVLFLDEPFEGVDAVAAGTLKAMLQRMIARGATVFLTSHVLEIVERLCTHVAIIHRGQLVAQGSLEELRAGGGRTGQAAEAAGRRRRAQESRLGRDFSRNCGDRSRRKSGGDGAGAGAFMAELAGARRDRRLRRETFPRGRSSRGCVAALAHLHEQPFSPAAEYARPGGRTCLCCHSAHHRVADHGD